MPFSNPELTENKQIFLKFKYNDYFFLSGAGDGVGAGSDYFFYGSVAN